MKEIYKRECCRLCDSKNLEVVFPYKPSPLCDAYVSDKNIVQNIYPLDLYLCQDCGLVQLLDIVNPEIIYRDYIYVTTSSMGLGEHFSGYAQDVIDRLALQNNSLMVDIGCNDGTLLRHLKGKGMKVLGVEPAVEIAKSVNASGIPCIAEFYNMDCAEAIIKEHGHAKVVTVNNLLANIDVLKETISAIYHLLDEDGVFVFESYYLADLIENKVFDFIYHEHISSFSVKPLQAFFKSIGMELFDIKRVPTKGGSLRYFIQKQKGAYEVKGIVDELIKHELQMGLYQKDIYLDYYKTIHKLKNDLHVMIDGLIAEGKTVAGFGASATTTTFLYHLELTDKIAYLIDDNKAKQNTYSPGCHIPVYPSDVLYEKKPDAVLVIAWRYADPIIKNQQKYLDEGGEFIVPLPELKVLQGNNVGEAV